MFHQAEEFWPLCPAASTFALMPYERSSGLVPGAETSILMWFPHISARRIKSTVKSNQEPAQEAQLSQTNNSHLV